MGVCLWDRNKNTLRVGYKNIKNEVECEGDKYKIRQK